MSDRASVAAHAAAILVTNSGPFGAHSKLYLVRDGAPARLFLGNAGQAAISRDGKRIAFVRDGAIWAMRRNTSGQMQLTKPTQKRIDGTPAWSADGKAIYFTRADHFDTIGSLWAIDADGSHERKLRQGPAGTGLGGEGTCYANPSVSPDGRRLVVTEIGSCLHGNDTSVLELTADGRSTTSAFRFPDSVFFEPFYSGAAWAPTGGEIAYGVMDFDGAGFSGIYVSAAHQRPKRLFGIQGSTDEFDNLHWSPDGRQIVATHGGEVWVLDVRHRTAAAVARQPAGENTSAAWFP